MKQKLTVDEQINHMKNKGVLFNIVTDEEAKTFISENTYYFKIKSYAKNYSKSKDDKYINLEFAALKELSTLDMYLRRIILITTLNIEHAIKTNINLHFCNNYNEDGYTIVKAFRSSLNFEEIKKNNYTAGMINKYDPDYAIWNYLEVISFGTLIDFYKYYYDMYDCKQKKTYPILYSIKMLRNISAHNNCLLNNIVKKSIKPCYHIKNYLSQGKCFSSNQLEKLNIPVIHDFAAMLFAVNFFTKSKNIIDHTYKELDTFVQRVKKHIDYFDKNLNIKNNLLFFEKLVDFFKSKAYNTNTEQKS